MKAAIAAAQHHQIAAIRSTKLRQFAATIAKTKSINVNIYTNNLKAHYVAGWLTGRSADKQRAKAANNQLSNCDFMEQ